MKRILFITNIPSPYRVSFFGELGKSVDLTVLYADDQADHTTRSAEWFIQGQGNYRSVFLKKRVLKVGEDSLCLDVIHWLKQDFDHVILGMYSSPTTMLAMLWMKLHGKPFWLEVDGGLIRQDSRVKYLVKRMLVSAPSGWISSGKYTTKYLVHYGAKEDRVVEYPFTSLWEADILKSVPTAEEKRRLRETLGMGEEKIALYVGRFLPEKGMDDLLEAAPALDRNIGIWFVGGEPTKEHLEFCREHDLSNVHFEGFRKKDALLDIYKAADLLVLPTKSDVWGLVINEAMACGLPVVTTDQCVAGLELIRDGENGYVTSVNDRDAMVEKIHAVLRGDHTRMGENALETIRYYTFENMARRHVEFLSEQEM